MGAVKLMYVVRGDRDLDRFRDTELRRSLARVGAQRLIVALDDADVADAQLRLSTGTSPVGAVVSVWADDPVGVTDVLAQLTALGEGGLDGWQVEERTPLPPPATPEGHRADALVNVALLRRPAAMSPESWRGRWLEHHTPVAIETQATFGYVQNLVVGQVAGDDRVDALVEEFFPMAACTDLHAFYGSDGDDDELGRRMHQMLESVMSFGAHENLDVTPTSRYEFDLASCS